MFDDMFRRRMTPPALTGCETLIDVGGNIGLATISLARQLPRLRAYVVEPDADNVRMLRLNLRPLADAGRCRIERGAMWRADEMVEVGPPPLPGSFGAVRCTEASGVGVTVQGMTMKTILDRSGFDRVDLLKLDVEGAEAAMFATGPNWLDRVGALAVEFHDDARRESDFDRVVAAHGMEIRETHNNGAIAIRSTATAPLYSAMT